MTQAMSAQNRIDKPRTQTIGIVAFPGVELIDLTGPLDTFALVNEGLKRSGEDDSLAYQFKVIGKAQGLITTACGLRVYADSAYADVSEGIDTLLVPGSPDVNMVLSDPELIEWVRAMSTRVRRLVSVCTGAFLLAKIGILDGRRATTHWAYCNHLATDYPSITVETDRIFVRDDFIATSGGITSGIDLTLSLIEEDWGREMALLTAQYMVVFLKRPGGQTQFSAYLASESTNHQDLRSLQVWIMDNPAEDLRNETLAERMNMSSRNFARVFNEETGMTPAKFVEKARIDFARQLLGNPNERIETVAIKAGFNDCERMRRAFVRNLGISPHEYRDRFGRSIKQPPPIMTPKRAQQIQDLLNQF